VSPEPSKVCAVFAAKNGTAAQPPVLTTPKGGAAIGVIDEKSSTNAVTGTGCPSVSLPFALILTLSYDSGSGNGPFGFGCSLSLPRVTRKNGKSIPGYFDDLDSEVFLLSDVEDLVQARLSTNIRDEVTRPGGGRPFTAMTCTGGRLTTSASFDSRADSQIADPADAKRVFSLLI
jgi:hypothetical protein